jgi:hypothetical protein
MPHGVLLLAFLNTEGLTPQSVWWRQRYELTEEMGSAGLATYRLVGLSIQICGHDCDVVLEVWKTSRWAAHRLTTGMRGTSGIVSQTRPEVPIMTAPITGPFSRLISLNGPPNARGSKPVWIEIQRKWYRQRKPYNLPLEFTFDMKRIELYKSNDPYSTKGTQNVPYWVDTECNDASYAKAYAKLVNALKKDSAQMAVSLAERKQALDMIAKRSIQLMQFSRALRKFRFGEACDILGISRKSQPKGVRAKGSSFGSNFLEFHFGWSPLIGDIGNAVETLQKGLPPFRVSTSCTSKRKFTEYTGSGFSYCEWKHDVSVSWRLTTEVEVSNPNLWLANQLGFVNPALVVWELVPFSFLLDWFVNVSDFLSSFTEFWGLSFQRPFRTRLQNYSRSGCYIQHPDREYWLGRYVLVQRIPGSFPGPALRVRSPWALSPTRGLTAISLLLQQLRK